MDKRRIIIGEYDTAENGWTLSAWSFSDAKYKENMVAKPAGDGAWDLSTALSDGIPRYQPRTLTATLERSDGDRSSREFEIRDMINALDGLQWEIYLPDDVDVYVVGRVSVARNYSDLAHASVIVTATCEPWKYSQYETMQEIRATSTAQIHHIYNGGRRAVVPTLEVEGGEVLLLYGNASRALSTGVYQVPDLLLTPGVHELTVSGSGLLRITYREAVLE
jgi:phage-related protein